MAADIDDGDYGHDDYYGSMADILAGLLFIFIIVAMVFAVVQRYVDEDVLQAAVERERAAADRLEEIEAREQRLAVLDQQLSERERKLALSEERIAEIERTLRIQHMLDARARLVKAIGADLAKEGLVVEIQPDQGIIGLTIDDLFSTGGMKLGKGGVRPASVLAKVLHQYLPCVSKSARGVDPGVPCKDYADARLANVQLTATSDTNKPGSAQAIILLSAMLQGHPMLYEFRNDRSQRLIDAREVDIEASAPPRGNRKKSEKGHIDLHFPLALPPAGPGRSVLPGNQETGDVR